MAESTSIFEVSQEYKFLLLNLRNTLCWWEVFVQEVFSLDLSEKEETATEECPPSFSWLDYVLNTKQDGNVGMHLLLF